MRKVSIKIAVLIVLLLAATLIFLAGHKAGETDKNGSNGTGNLHWTETPRGMTYEACTGNGYALLRDKATGVVTVNVANHMCDSAG